MKTKDYTTKKELEQEINWLIIENFFYLGLLTGILGVMVLYTII